MNLELLNVADSMLEFMLEFKVVKNTWQDTEAYVIDQKIQVYNLVIVYWLPLKRQQESVNKFMQRERILKKETVNFP